MVRFQSTTHSLGISVYPERCSLEETLDYIDAAGERGFRRVFSCLLSMDKDREALLAQFQPIAERAHAHDMVLVLDVWPMVLERLGVGPQDLSFIRELGADGLRLDMPYAGGVIAMMSHRPEGLVLEVNASMPDGTFASALEAGADPERLWACHNYYPQRYSGLDLDFFEEMSLPIHEAGLRLAAFVGCEDHEALGPWGAGSGLPTLEMHRDLAPDLAARHLFATGLVDDVIVSDCFATEAELDALASVDPKALALRIELEEGLADSERKVAFETEHSVRGDLSPYIVRSLMSRFANAEASIPPRACRDMVRGDVVVVNDNDRRYKGELQIVLRDMENLGLHNVVGHIPEEEQILMPYLRPWQPFSFMA